MDSPTAPEAQLHLTMINRLPDMEEIKHRVRAFAFGHKITEDMTARILTVIDEVVNNIISYAYSDTDEHEIHFRLRYDGTRFVVTITDDGNAFDVTTREASDTGRSLEARAIGGLGIHLVHSLMDEVEYERTGGRNILTLVKNIDSV